MFYQVRSAISLGLNIIMLRVEVDISDGLPILQMVGSLSSEAKEAGDKVRAVLKNNSFSLPAKRIIINIAPGNIKKTGTSLDFPILVALLGAMGYIDSKEIENMLFIGEISLSGDILGSHGILPILSKAKKEGIKKCMVSSYNYNEARVNTEIEIIPISNIKDVINYFKNKDNYINNFKTIDNPKIKSKYKIDYKDIKGQENLKQSAIIAACGMHNSLLIGPPGSGKSMWAKRLPTIQPDLTASESIELSKIYSIKGLLNNNEPLITTRPFRAPHHSMSSASLIGGGSIPMPGEVSLANYGILFLDELPEYPRNIIEALRQPLEDKKITIARSKITCTYPANFQLVAAMNPCPCGYYPDLNKCRCNDFQINRYLGKISGPFIDRIDLCVSVNPVTFTGLIGEANPNEMSSNKMRDFVMIGRQRQEYRYRNENILFNSELSPKQIEKFCFLNSEIISFISSIYNKFNLTARTYHKLIRVSRTIADINDRDEISIYDVKEALYYRDISYLKR